MPPFLELIFKQRFDASFLKSGCFFFLSDLIVDILTACVCIPNLRSPTVFKSPK